MNVTIDPLNFTERFKLMAWGNRTYNWSSALKNAPTITNRDSIIIAFYSLIILISIFGNLLVCNIVARSAKMRSSTYVFIANLALSDFMMTVLNIPFNVARILLNDWPFGSFMCSFVPLVQVTSVYVSTFTMTCIAVDRYRIISKPLEPRLRSAQTIKMLVVVVILFALCWFPLNTFNLLREFIPKAFMQKSVTHSTVFFICHWLAMSSVCYNPFIYCWLNDHFRSGALSCLLCIKNAGRQLNDSFKSTKLSRLSSVPTTVTVDYGFNSSQDANNDSCCSNAVQMTSKRSSLDRSRSFRHSYEFDIPLKSLPSKTTQASLKRCSASKSNVKVSTTLVGGELQSTNFTISEEAC
ncbi:putative G-protein coupled receptor 83 like protein [Argiope bruennichi]|uniref:Putative G-protein coupled receptor 83 like protein n=1 Tax=Argiope bruennichi TaxID=94029 RepID=A0A8T0FLM9_ARGBR|nr:putative G-protein coupled receptor 83 like protein [Argiope bruennichi]